MMSVDWLDRCRRRPQQFAREPSRSGWFAVRRVRLCERYAPRCCLEEPSDETAAAASIRGARMEPLLPLGIEAREFRPSDYLARRARVCFVSAMPRVLWRYWERLCGIRSDCCRKHGGEGGILPLHPKSPELLGFFTPRSKVHCTSSVDRNPIGLGNDG